MDMGHLKNHVNRYYWWISKQCMHGLAKGGQKSAKSEKKMIHACFSPETTRISNVKGEKKREYPGECKGSTCIQRVCGKNSQISRFLANFLYNFIILHPDSMESCLCQCFSAYVSVFDHLQWIILVKVNGGASKYM